MTSPEPPAQPTQPTSPPPGFQPPPQYRPPQYGPPPTYVPRPPGRRLPGWAIALIVIGAVIVVGCIGGVLLIGAGAKSVVDSNNAASKDVTISSCGDGGQFLGPQAQVSITNHGSGSANYLVTVAFQSQDGTTQYGTGTAIANDLAAGQTTTADATSFNGNVAPGTTYNCVVSHVTRI